MGQLVYVSLFFGGVAVIGGHNKLFLGLTMTDINCFLDGLNGSSTWPNIGSALLGRGSVFAMKPILGKSALLFDWLGFPMVTLQKC